MRTTITLLLFALLSSACAAPPPPDAPPHHTADGFRNYPLINQNNFLDFLHWQWDRLWKEIPGVETYDFPLAENDPAALRANGGRTTLTWIGHATVLLQVEGKNILTDPHFSPRASPVQWAGPQRVVPPGMALEELPPIDLVVISHSHYDALDAGSVERLAERPGGSRTLFVVPLGLKGWFAKRGIENVVELDWWQETEVGGLTVTAVPVQHWSKRSLFGRNRTLWAGFAIRGAGFNFLFAGDSGYAPHHFREIGARLGPFDLAAIPIGAYAPRWFMGKNHVDPEESLQIHRDVRARRSVAIHWGTFVLTDEPLDEPPLRLRASREALGMAEEDFAVLRHGETIFP
jgi:L-ascorbate metabolism protein UlaG (beta-lactamase superfamily)